MKTQDYKTVALQDSFSFNPFNIVCNNATNDDIDYGQCLMEAVVDEQMMTQNVNIISRQSGVPFMATLLLLSDLPAGPLRTPTP